MWFLKFAIVIEDVRMIMSKPEEDEKREYRIDMEIVVDAYDEGERAMGWYCYLQDKITFPFKARVINKVKASPSKKDEIVIISGMADEEECFKTMFVVAESNDCEFEIPLEKIYPVYADRNIDNATLEAIEDWHYWINRGYCF